MGARELWQNYKETSACDVTLRKANTHELKSLKGRFTPDLYFHLDFLVSFDPTFDSVRCPANIQANRSNKSPGDRMPLRNLSHKKDDVPHFVATPVKARPKSHRKFQPAIWDKIWDRWVKGIAVPMLLAAVAAAMVWRDYAILPGRFRWTVYHGLDAQLLAISVLGLAGISHVRGYWSNHRKLSSLDGPAHALCMLISVSGIVGMLIHQASGIFR